ncbi:MAG: hypothetical protein NC245_01590 [Muribaculum sp.]|nr:hypothetical protein [Muribaculum sp.]
MFYKFPAVRFHILTSFLVGKLVVFPPFRGAILPFEKNAEHFPDFFQKVFEHTKCARLQGADRRKGIVGSIQLIRQFIFIGVVFPGGGRAFFDVSMTVGFCRYALRFMAATSFSRRICWRSVAQFFSEDNLIKETAALIYSKPPPKDRLVSL